MSLPTIWNPSAPENNRTHVLIRQEVVPTGSSASSGRRSYDCVAVAYSKEARPRVVESHTRRPERKLASPQLSELPWNFAHTDLPLVNFVIHYRRLAKPPSPRPNSVSHRSDEEVTLWTNQTCI